MANLITIDQLLESVDLDFEPRFVTKDNGGAIWVWSGKPDNNMVVWNIDYNSKHVGGAIGKIKLSEFSDKDWQECIYEVPRKTPGKIEKLDEHAGNMQLSSASMTRNQFVANTIMKKINELVDAVNELKANSHCQHPDSTDEDLRKMMRDPKYWRDKDSGIIQKIKDGFNKLYGDKN